MFELGQQVCAVRDILNVDLFGTPYSRPDGEVRIEKGTAGEVVGLPCVVDARVRVAFERGVNGPFEDGGPSTWFVEQDLVKVARPEIALGTRVRAVKPLSHLELFGVAERCGEDQVVVPEGTLGIVTSDAPDSDCSGVLHQVYWVRVNGDHDREQFVNEDRIEPA